MPAPSTERLSSDPPAALLHSLRDAVQAQESGLAETPLTRTLHSLLEPGDAGSITALLLGLDETARRSALAVLLGGGEVRYPLCQIIVPPREQAGRGDGTLLQRVQRREDRRGKGMIAPHIFAAPAAAQMALRGIEERRSRVTRCAARCGV